MNLIKSKIENEILWITLSDRQTGNAFSPQMANEFHKVRTSTKHSALVVQSEGRFFCSGGNLRHYQGLASKEEGLEQNRNIFSILEELDQSLVPTLALVDGIVLGGGIELLSAFHKVLATPQSLFGLWQRRIGLTFGWGGQARLERRLGVGATRRWLRSGLTHCSWKAQEMGLVDEVCLRGDLLVNAASTIDNFLILGEDSFRKIQNNGENQERAFAELWMTGRHKEVLSKF